MARNVSKRVGKRSRHYQHTGKAGGPRWEPDAETRLRVKAWIIAGYSQEEIAARLGVSSTTLRARCRAELDEALMDAVTQTGASVLQMANGRPALYDPQTGRLLRAEVVPDIAAARFFLRTKGRDRGWAERLELTGADGAALFRDLNLAALSDAELDTFIALCGKIGLRLPFTPGIGAPTGS